MSALDARFNSEIFRKNHPMILAANRHLASLKPVRLAYNSSGYAAGTVLGRNTTSLVYQAYNDGGSSGINVAKCITMDATPVEDFDSSTGTCLAVAIFGGEVFEDKLTGLDAAGKVDLGSKSIIDATGVTILKF